MAMSVLVVDGECVMGSESVVRCLVCMACVACVVS